MEMTNGHVDVQIETESRLCARRMFTITLTTAMTLTMPWLGVSIPLHVIFTWDIGIFTKIDSKILVLEKKDALYGTEWSRGDMALVSPITAKLKSMRGFAVRVHVLHLDWHDYPGNDTLYQPHGISVWKHFDLKSPSRRTENRPVNHKRCHAWRWTFRKYYFPGFILLSSNRSFG